MVAGRNPTFVEEKTAVSQMRCTCGNVISDTRYPAPTEGSLLRQGDEEVWNVTVAADVAAFFEAKRAGRHELWLTEYFAPSYPLDLDDIGVVSDILTRTERMLSVAECEGCGRLWVQEQYGVNSYRAYSPDRPGYAAILRARASSGS